MHAGMESLGWQQVDLHEQPGFHVPREVAVERPHAGCDVEG
jgi:hypothetical protein